MQNNKLKKNLTRKIKLFKTDTSGQISIMLVLLLIPLMAFVGGALDFTQKITYKNKLQATLDSVSLAVAKAIAKDANVKDAKLDEIANSFYLANHQTAGNVTDSQFTVVRTDKLLTVSQNSNLSTSFMKLIGTPNLPIQVTSIVNISRSDIELALILDTTLSMVLQPDPNKLNNLKTASRKLVTTLLDGSAGVGSVRIGLVPWSTGVNVWSKRTKVIKGNKKGNHYCAGSRKKPSDTSPTLKKLPYSYGNKKWNDKKPEQCPNREILGLTDNKTKLLAEIDLWQADHWTASDVGLTWGWGVLSPNWNTYWPNKAKAKAYNSGVRKFAVLMTDGDNTLDHIDSDERSVALCDAMKEKNIRIYTIAFKVETTDAVALLKSCASMPDMYINASSAEALNAAFQKIADEVGSFYISG